MLSPPFVNSQAYWNYTFRFAGAQSGTATVTGAVLLLTVIEPVKHDFVTYCRLSKLPHLSLLAAKRTLGKLATALLWTWQQIVGIGLKKARNTW